MSFAQIARSFLSKCRINNRAAAHELADVPRLIQQSLQNECLHLQDLVVLVLHPGLGLHRRGPCLLTGPPRGTPGRRRLRPAFSSYTIPMKQDLLWFPPE